MKQETELESLNIDSTLYKTRLSEKFRNRQPYKAPDPSMIISFISGTVLEIPVREGQKVCKGDDLMILEAMKMQNEIQSPGKGKVIHVIAKPGSNVMKDDVMVEIKVE